MTTVCPALLPPWYLTTKSTRSPSRSVALPLPSSPHWAPTSTMAGMLIPFGWRKLQPGSRGSTTGPGLAVHDEAPAQAQARQGLLRSEITRLGGQFGRGGGAAVAQELRAPLGLVVFADRRGGRGQHVQRTQEAAVRLVLPRDRAVSVPARAAQLVEGAVIARPRVRVGRDGVALPERAGGQRGPGRRIRREARRDVRGRLARPQRARRLLISRQVGGRRPAEQVLAFHQCP